MTEKELYEIGKRRSESKYKPIPKDKIPIKAEEISDSSRSFLEHSECTSNKIGEIDEGLPYCISKFIHGNKSDGFDR